MSINILILAAGILLGVLLSIPRIRRDLRADRARRRSR